MLKKIIFHLLVTVSLISASHAEEIEGWDLFDWMDEALKGEWVLSPADKHKAAAVAQVQGPFRPQHTPAVSSLPYQAGLPSGSPELIQIMPGCVDSGPVLAAQ